MLGDRWTLGLKGAALFGPQDKRHQTSRWEPLEATVDFGTLYKRPISSSGLESVEVIMIMRLQSNEL
ncbi:jg26513 [Pararge aegeria aegeria]|uniref:Jg26513 protein n=1 Tax=Pararge aegeria aegeria TaxID=348720 RepID=A0A8S4QJK8_9NEOP|nr:jg26513 [Pararge aegeria aegeria]